MDTNFSYIGKGSFKADKSFNSEDVEISKKEKYENSDDFNSIGAISTIKFHKSLNTTRINFPDYHSVSIKMDVISYKKGSKEEKILNKPFMKDFFLITLNKKVKRDKFVIDDDNYTYHWNFEEDELTFCDIVENVTVHKKYSFPFLQELVYMINDYFIPNKIKLNGMIGFTKNIYEIPFSPFVIVVIDNAIYIGNINIDEEKEKAEEMDYDKETFINLIIKKLTELTELSSFLIEDEDEDIKMTSIVSSLPPLPNKRKRSSEDLEKEKEVIIYIVKDEERDKEKVYYFSSMNKVLKFIKNQLDENENGRYKFLYDKEINERDVFTTKGERFFDDLIDENGYVIIHFGSIDDHSKAYGFVVEKSILDNTILPQKRATISSLPPLERATSLPPLPPLSKSHRM